MKKKHIVILTLLFIQGCSSNTNMNSKKQIAKNASLPKQVAIYKPKTLIKRVSCKNFTIQLDAQRYFDAKKRGWKSLDRDKDGEPCECLKGGSQEHKSVCKLWKRKNQKR